MIQSNRFFINDIDQTTNLLDFAKTIGLEHVAAERYSSLFLIELFIFATTGRIHLGMVMDEIKYLEGSGKPTGTKTATAFTGKTLSGLWHKHHSESSVQSMATNLKHALREHGLPSFDAMIEEAKNSDEDRYMAKEDIGKIVHDAVVNNYMRRSNACKLTGEWIVFAKNEGKNYYLCLGKHDSGDDAIRKKIESICLPEFPFLANILTLEEGA